MHSASQAEKKQKQQPPDLFQKQVGLKDAWMLVTHHLVVDFTAHDSHGA